MAQSTRSNGSPVGRGVQDLVDALRGRIVRGELEPGRRLTEDRLAAEFGVSRIPVREALRTLASEGFVRTERHVGTFVATLDAAAARDLLDVRAVLEPLAAAQAAMRCTPEDLETFHRLLAEGERASRDDRYEDMRTIRGQIYEHLAVASQDSTLIELMRRVRFKIEWATSIDELTGRPIEMRHRRAKALREIVEAIAERDPARAATAAAANIDAAYASAGWRRVVDVRFEGPGSSDRPPGYGVA